jgi:hypothetical protein
VLISTITFSAKIAKLAELPTDVVGMMPPSSVIATASMIATSGFLTEGYAFAQQFQTNVGQ